MASQFLSDEVAEPSSPLTSPPDSENEITVSPLKHSAPGKARQGDDHMDVEMDSIIVHYGGGDVAHTNGQQETPHQEMDEPRDVPVQQANGKRANGRHIVKDRDANGEEVANGTKFNGRQAGRRRVIKPKKANGNQVASKKQVNGKRSDGKQTSGRRVTRQSSQKSLKDNHHRGSQDGQNKGGSHDQDDDYEPESEIQVSAEVSSQAKRSHRGAFGLAGPSSAAKKTTVKVKSKKWTPDYVTQNAKSPLADVDLRTLLLHPAAWDLLSIKDKGEILAQFPDNKHILNPGTAEAAPNIGSLANDDNFRHDTTQYIEKLTGGQHDAEWLDAAWGAHGNRVAGNLDGYVFRKLETDYDIKIPDKYKPAHLRQPESLTTEPNGSEELDELAGKLEDYATKDNQKDSTAAEANAASPANSTNNVTNGIGNMDVGISTT